MSISNLLLNFDEVKDVEANPLSHTNCSSGAQVLIDLTIPLNFFIPFLNSIRIGIDLVAGMGSVYVLLENLRWYLEDIGITSLNHAHNWGVCTSN